MSQTAQRHHPAIIAIGIPGLLGRSRVVLAVLSSSQGEGQYSSSHSSSNTLSSNASSSHSDERWFETPDLTEVELDPLARGGSSDSGIDATSIKPSRRDKQPPKLSPPHGPALHEGNSSKRREPSPVVGCGGQNRGYRPKASFGTSGVNMPSRGGKSNSNDQFKQPRLVFGSRSEPPCLFFPCT